MKKILITGGAGFIGSHLADYYVKSGCHVVVLDKLLRGNKLEKSIFNEIEFYEGDVKDYNLVEKISKGCELVFHLAAIIGVDIVADYPVDTMDTEVVGTRNVVNAALKNNVKKIIYASTSGVYGNTAIEENVIEEIIIAPHTSYAMAKRYNEIYLKAIYEEKNLESISLRFFNVYGKRQDQRMVIPIFFNQAFNNKPLTVFAPGKQTRDFTHVDDTIKATALLAEESKGAEIYNVANETEITILELAKYIVKITGSKSAIKLIESPKKRYDYEVERRVGNSNKLYELTGFKPNMNIKNRLIDLCNTLK